MQAISVTLRRIRNDTATITVDYEDGIPDEEVIAIAKAQVTKDDWKVHSEEILADFTDETLMEIYKFWLVDPSDPIGEFKPEHLDFVKARIEASPKPTRCWLFWKMGEPLCFSASSSPETMAQPFSGEVDGYGSFDVDIDAIDAEGVVLRSIASTLLCEVLSRAEAKYRR